MAKSQTIVVTLTEPQFDTVQRALDVYYNIQMENQDRYSTQRAQVANRAGEAIATAWRRAEDGF